MKFAGLEREVIVSGNLSEIEIWSKDRYENGLEWDQEVYSSLLDEVLGDDDTISDGLEQLLR
jgi:DNA-binding transcriptional regulator/RsmH inhibitor MraZ